MHNSSLVAWMKKLWQKKSIWYKNFLWANFGRIVKDNGAKKLRWHCSCNITLAVGQLYFVLEVILTLFCQCSLFMPAENLCFPGVFRGYKMRIYARKRLKYGTNSRDVLTLLAKKSLKRYPYKDTSDKNTYLNTVILLKIQTRTLIIMQNIPWTLRTASSQNSREWTLLQVYLL